MCGCPSHSLAMFPAHQGGSLPTGRWWASSQVQRSAAVRRYWAVLIVDTASSAQTCRYYGISGTCFYKWLRRYQDEGLEVLRDRSSKPHHELGVLGGSGIRIGWCSRASFSCCTRGSGGNTCHRSSASVRA